VIESRVEEPLVSLAVLRRRTVALGNLGGLTTFAMASSVVFLGTLFLQQVHGMSPTGSGLVFGVLGAAAAIGGMVAPRAVGRFGAPRTIVARAARPGGVHSGDRHHGPWRRRHDPADRRHGVGLRAHLSPSSPTAWAATSGLFQPEQGWPPPGHHGAAGSASPSASRG